MNSSLSDNLREILDLMAADRHSAAIRLEAMAAGLNELARQLREAGGANDVGGMVDRVRTRVIGPTGTVVIETDTGAS